MAYSQKFVEWLTHEPIAKKCFCCGVLFRDKEYREVHSSTGYHLALTEAKDDGRYIYVVTDPPDCYPEMLGEIIEINDREFHLEKKYEGDAVVVHHHCHKAIKLFALALCREKNRDFRGGVPMPKRLHEVTHNFRHYMKEYGALLKEDEE